MAEANIEVRKERAGALSTESGKSAFDKIMEQIRLLGEKFNLPPSAAERYYVVPMGGKYYKLCKYESPIKIFDLDDGDHTASIVGSQKLYSDRVNVRRKRGKYEDEGRLVVAHSIEVGEVAGWVAPF